MSSVVCREWRPGRVGLLRRTGSGNPHGAYVWRSKPNQEGKPHALSVGVWWTSDLGLRGWLAGDDEEGLGVGLVRGAVGGLEKVAVRVEGRQAASIASAQRHHAASMPSPCHRHAIATPALLRHYPATTPLSCRQHIISTPQA